MDGVRFARVGGYRIGTMVNLGGWVLSAGVESVKGFSLGVAVEEDWWW